MELSLEELVAAGVVVELALLQPEAGCQHAANPWADENGGDGSL